LKTGISSLISGLFSGLSRWLTRLLLVLAALVFFVCLLTVAALLLAVWLVRALWARLTGKKVAPWVFRVDPRAHWSGFGPPPARGQGTSRGSTGVIDVVDVTDVTDVTDVIAREIKVAGKSTDRSV
jgi:hypothetical protein